MQLTRDDLIGLTTLLAVADKRSFTAAAAALRVTPSAVSQSVSAAEQRVGIRLFARTTRSVSPTEAGARFLAELRPALEQVEAAFAVLDEARGRPTGTLRLTVPRLASAWVVEPMLARFLDEHPELRLDVSVEDGFVDLVAGGYDAGIRIGEMLDKEVVAVPLTGPMRVAIVASPAYVGRHGKPKRPRDLLAHECINYRRVHSGTIYRWEFTERGRDLTIGVDGRIVTNDQGLMLRAALDGMGIAYMMENAVAERLADGSLVRLLASYCPPFPGLHLYFASRKQLPPKLRALVDFFRKEPRRRRRPE